MHQVAKNRIRYFKSSSSCWKFEWIWPKIRASFIFWQVVQCKYVKHCILGEVGNVALSLVGNNLLGVVGEDYHCCIESRRISLATLLSTIAVNDIINSYSCLFTFDAEVNFYMLVCLYSHVGEFISVCSIRVSVHI